MKPIVIKDNKLEQLKWDTTDILQKCSPKEQREVLDLRDKHIRRDEYYYKLRMDLIEH